MGGARVELITLARDIGFDFTGRFDAGRLEFREDVRAMCAGGRCQRYGRSWSCPRRGRYWKPSSRMSVSAPNSVMA